MVFFVLLAVPLIVALAGYVLSKGKVTLKELGVQVGAQIVIAGVSAVIVHYSNVHDTEVWNGRVVAKQSEHVSCSHSYQCHCHNECSGSGKNRSCSEHCDTCYEHPYDVDWNVYTSNKGEVVEIDRIDRQGVDEPPRFTKVQLGEPTTVPHGYTNYVKASPDTLFRRQGLLEKYAGTGLIPPYPDHIYDYWHLNRLVLVGGAQVPDPREWNKALAELNAEVGRPKQANVIVVLVKGQGQEYFYALEQAWIGGKKNDVVLVIGVDDQLVPQWATVMAWTTQEMFKVKLRDDIMGDSTPLTVDRVMGALKTDVNQYYVRKPMADFEYLEASITPTPLQWGLSLGISLAVAIGLTILMIRVDLFNEERGSWLRDPFAYRGTPLGSSGTAPIVFPFSSSKKSHRRRPRGL